MAILRKGKYLGKYKKDNKIYFKFSTEKIAFNGDIQNVRIGDYNRIFPNDRDYILLKQSELNGEELSLVQKNYEIEEK